MKEVYYTTDRNGFIEYGQEFNIQYTTGQKNLKDAKRIILSVYRREFFPEVCHLKDIKFIKKLVKK